MSDSTQSYTYRFDGLRWIWPDGTKSYEPPPQVAEQIRAYGRHYNARIEIVRWSREQYRAARTALIPELAAAEEAYRLAREQVEALRIEAKALKVEARSRAVGTELRARLTAAVLARKAAGAALKAAKERAKVDPGLSSANDEINAERTRREKEARAATPAFWGTYLMAEDASQVAARSKNDPRFRPWNAGLPVSTVAPCPDGKIGMQVQSPQPLTVQGLYEQRDSRIQLEPPPPKTRWKPEWVRGRIRIGSDGRAPIWAEFEVRHRHDMPRDARITWAWIKRWSVGTHRRHALYIGVERPARAAHPLLDRVLALDLNMRIVKDGIRIGYSFDGKRSREYVLPQAIVDKLRHADEIKSTRDHEFDTFRDELSAWLKTADVPAWLRERTQHLPAWKSSARLAGVVLHWRVNRFADDDTMYLRAEQWRAQDRHLANYRTGDERGARNRRVDLYRQWAREMFAEYGTVIVAAWDWSQIARRPQVEEESSIPEAVRSMRFAVAPSELVQALGNGARHRGGRLIKAALSDLGAVGCLACHATAISEDKESGWVVCMQCGHRSVRDEVQARALYAARERVGGDDPTGGARVDEDAEIVGESAPSGT